MASSARLPFDARGPFVVASEELVVDRRYRRGETFPQDRFSDFDLLTLWRALKIDVAVAPSAPPALPIATADLDIDRMSPEQLAELEAATAPVAVTTPESQLVPMRLTPGEHVTVELPTARGPGRGRRNGR